MKDKKLLGIIQLALSLIVLITFFLPAIDAKILTTGARNSFSGSDLSFGYTSNGYVMSKFNLFIFVLYFIPVIASLLNTYLGEKFNWLKYLTLGLNVVAVIGFILVIPVLFQPIGGYVYIDGTPIASNNYQLLPGFGLIGAIVFSIFSLGANGLLTFYNKIFGNNSN